MEKAPRTVEIDLLLFGEEVLDGQDFRAPHRGISRTDNLVGLADLDPSIRIPRLGPVTVFSRVLTSAGCGSTRAASSP